MVVFVGERAGRCAQRPARDGGVVQVKVGQLREAGDTSQIARDAGVTQAEGGQLRKASDASQIAHDTGPGGALAHAQVEMGQPSEAGGNATEVAD